MGKSSFKRYFTRGTRSSTCASASEINTTTTNTCKTNADTDDDVEEIVRTDRFWTERNKPKQKRGPAFSLPHEALYDTQTYRDFELPRSQALQELCQELSVKDGLLDNLEKSCLNAVRWVEPRARLLESTGDWDTACPASVVDRLDRLSHYAISYKRSSPSSYATTPRPSAFLGPPSTRQNESWINDSLGGLEFGTGAYGVQQIPGAYGRGDRQFARRIRYLTECFSNYNKQKEAQQSSIQGGTAISTPGGGSGTKGNRKGEYSSYTSTAPTTIGPGATATSISNDSDLLMRHGTTEARTDSEDNASAGGWTLATAASVGVVAASMAYGGCKVWQALTTEGD